MNIFDFISGVQVGSEIYCVGCGELISYYDEIVNGNQCDNCKKATCSHCGREIDVDDAICIDWEIYCSDCVERCDDCGEYFLPSQLMRVGEYEYCEICAMNNSVMCEVCGQIIHCDDCHVLDNGVCLCDDCIDDYNDDDDDDDDA